MTELTVGLWVSFCHGISAVNGKHGRVDMDSKQLELVFLFKPVLSVALQADSRWFRSREDVLPSASADMAPSKPPGTPLWPSCPFPRLALPPKKLS